MSYDLNLLYINLGTVVFKNVKNKDSGLTYLHVTGIDCLEKNFMEHEYTRRLLFHSSQTCFDDFLILR